jgi:hypothetical protein
VDTLESSIVNAITLFAPRRMGKTQFACMDLAPLAARKGWLVAATCGTTSPPGGRIGRDPRGDGRVAIRSSPTKPRTLSLRLEREGFLERAMRGGYAVADPMVSIWLGRVRVR